ncbi:DNA-protecting protein DprA [Thomasclavelia sp.]|uniref:DNA-protecting protein DprA n=1 Tax=Thomasclavelia sp. TaxID=3025757 RepID=UPI0025EC85BC|nr:DNA-protecting protein DprA [Thomasclavelia sp.]
MDRKEIIELMKDVYTSSEAAEYLNVSTQRLNQLVHDKQIEPIKISKSVMLFLKSDLDKRRVVNISNINVKKQKNQFNIDNSFVREVILYYTIQQYFNQNDRRTSQFIEQIKETHDFSFSNKLTQNIPLLSNTLQTNEKEFYERYIKVKNSFILLDGDVIITKKGDEIYSRLLNTTNEASPFLFLKGNVDLLNEKSVCVVGSRNASADSMKKTERIVKSLVQRNIVINAGLAKGIDTAAHTSALKHGGKTIAVIGTPINQYYPKENKDLQIEIEKKGLVVSQFPPCNKVQRWNFPTRNGVMSGLSIATIIMEAGETSGALKQADYALKQNRDVLIPQSALNNQLISWPNKYISKGAYSFKNLKEVLEKLNQNDLLLNTFNETDMEELSDVEMD